MNEANHNYREYGGISCYFHPKENIIGVCHLCLNERLHILAAKQGLKSKSSSKFYFNNSKKSNNNNKAKSSYVVALPKIFAIASFFSPNKDNLRHRSRRRESKSNHHHDFFDDADTTSTSLEEDDSFISIKFGDNGVASWDKTSKTMSSKEQQCSLSWGGQTSVKDATTIKGTSGGNNNTKSVVEHAKPRAASMRWRKRIAQLLQVLRWKKCSKAATIAGGGGGNSSGKVVEGVKVVRNNKSWIRTLKRRS